MSKMCIEVDPVQKYFKAPVSCLIVDMEEI